MEQTLTDCFSTQNLITFRLCHNSPKLSSGYTKPHQKNVSRPHNTTQKTDCPNVAPIQSYGGKNLNWFLFRQFFIFQSRRDSTNLSYRGPSGCIKSIQDNCVTTRDCNAKELNAALFRHCCITAEQTLTDSISRTIKHFPSRRKSTNLSGCIKSIRTHLCHDPGFQCKIQKAEQFNRFGVAAEQTLTDSFFKQLLIFHFRRNSINL
jgi:hypothetical protein